MTSFAGCCTSAASQPSRFVLRLPRDRQSQWILNCAPRQCLWDSCETTQLHARPVESAKFYTNLTLIAETNSHNEAFIQLTPNRNEYPY